MTNVKISKKGKALLKNRALSAVVAKAIIEQGEKLYSKEGIVISINGRKLTVKGAGSGSVSVK
jgi:hypothetical protein